MALRVEISDRAEVDLTNQYRWYVENANLEVADRVLAEFDAVARKLGRHPEFGRARRFRSPELAGIRSLPVGGRFGVHLVFYRKAADVLRVERVMHGARDLPRRLLERPKEQVEPLD
jgi:plasmid stabilization system protein ParE